MPTYLYPVLVVGALLVLSFGMRTAMAASRPEHRLGNIAQTLGLTVTEGNPNYNLIVGEQGFFLFRLFGVTKYDVKLRASGMAGPYSVELGIEEKVLRIKLRRAVLKDDHFYTAHITISGVAIPAPFEAWRPAAYDGPVPKCGLPIVGQAPTASGPWQLACTDPNATQWLAPLLYNLAQNASHFHITGDNGSITLWFTHVGMSAAVLQLPFLRDELFRLVTAFSGSQPPRWHGHAS